MTKENAERVIWEFKNENSKDISGANVMGNSFTYTAILYDFGEMIVAFPHKISYFYIKEELFTKEKLREISLDFLKKRKSRS